MKETFIDPLLHPHTHSSSSTMLECDNVSQVETLVESHECLPVASHFLSDNPDDSQDNNGRARATSLAFHWGGKPNLNISPDHDPREPLPSRAPRHSFVSSRSHRSLPPPPRPNPNAASTQSFVRSLLAEKEQDRDHKPTSTNSGSRMILRKSKKSLSKADSIASGGVAPYQIPDDLRQCLEVIDDCILAGHLKLKEALRKRYDGQYPLVRSLADVFLAHVRLVILPSYCPDHRRLVLVSLPQGLCRLCSTSGTGPRASQ